MAQETEVSVRLVFADRGSFHDVVVRLPAEILDDYERLIDALQEDPRVLSRVHVDSRRLVAAYREGTDEAD